MIVFFITILSSFSEAAPHFHLAQYYISNQSTEIPDFQKNANTRHFVVQFVGGSRTCIWRSTVFQINLQLRPDFKKITFTYILRSMCTVLLDTDIHLLFYLMVLGINFPELHACTPASISEDSDDGMMFPGKYPPSGVEGNFWFPNEF